MAGVNRAGSNVKSSGGMVGLFIGVTMAALVLALLFPNVFDQKRHPLLSRVVAHAFAGGVFLGIVSAVLADIVIDDVMANHGYRVCSIQF